MEQPKPLLIVSDSISASTGLARIARDLATRIHDHLGDVYRLATAGYGSPGSSKFGFPQYSLEGRDGWVLPTLPEIWDDFAGTEKGVVLFIWDPCRVTWFADPNGLGRELLAHYPALTLWLKKAKLEKWIYAPLDASGPNDKLTFPLQRTLLGFDRILAYGKWGEDLIRRSIGNEEASGRRLTHLPHGIDLDVFYQINRDACRKLFLAHTGASGAGTDTRPIAKDDMLVGIVATNQARKDWALGIETVAIMKRDHKVRLWIHTDELERHWSIPALLIDHNLVDETLMTTGYLPDAIMAEAYSACDVTLGIGAGEGYGYPIHESLFCGTPCVHGYYGGAPEWMTPDPGDLTLLVAPCAYRYEGVYASKRPVFNPEAWAAKATGVAKYRMNRNGDLDWRQLWPKWETWFRGGAQ